MQQSKHKRQRRRPPPRFFSQHFRCKTSKTSNQSTASSSNDEDFGGEEICHKCLTIITIWYCLSFIISLYIFIETTYLFLYHCSLNSVRIFHMDSTIGILKLFFTRVEIYCNHYISTQLDFRRFWWQTLSHGSSRYSVLCLTYCSTPVMTLRTTTHQSVHCELSLCSKDEIKEKVFGNDIHINCDII